MNSTIVSVPGKIILAGEHSVVYGEPAMVAAVSRRLEVGLSFRNDKRMVIKSKDKGFELARFAVKECLKELGKESLGVEVKIQSEIPAKRGMGSSAALATGIVWSILKDKPLEIKDKLVKIIEDKQHGKSSGVDQTIVREGGILRYQKGVGFEKLQIPNLEFVLIDSGKPVESTGEMVEKVSLGNNKKEFKRMGEIAEKWEPSLIQENEYLLEKIGVVGEKAQGIVRKVELSGGMAKICGAGGVIKGSGIILAVDDKIDRLKQLAQNNNWQWFQVSLGVKGVSYEKD
jgi:mevalonate kinase